MRLLIVRHAIAMERQEFHKVDGRDDGERPLTAEGIRKMKKNAEGLRQVAPRIDVLATSPLVRAVQTAEIISSAYDQIPFRKRHELKPDKHPSMLLDWLKNLPSGPAGAKTTFAVVGHEPQLSGLLGYLITGRAEPIFEIRKGGACMLDFKKSLEPGEAFLEWVLTPSLLRALR